MWLTFICSARSEADEEEIHSNKHQAGRRNRDHIAIPHTTPRPRHELHISPHDGSLRVARRVQHVVEVVHRADDDDADVERVRAGREGRRAEVEHVRGGRGHDRRDERRLRPAVDAVEGRRGRARVRRDDAEDVDRDACRAWLVAGLGQGGRAHR